MFPLTTQQPVSQRAESVLSPMTSGTRQDETRPRKYKKWIALLLVIALGIAGFFTYALPRAVDYFKVRKLISNAEALQIEKRYAEGVALLQKAEGLWKTSSQKTVVQTLQGNLARYQNYQELFAAALQRLFEKDFRGAKAMLETIQRDYPDYASVTSKTREAQKYIEEGLDASDRTPYQNTEYGFELTYPKEWRTMIGYERPDIIAFFDSPTGSKLRAYSFEMHITAEDVSRRDIQEWKADYEARPDEHISIGGAPALEKIERIDGGAIRTTHTVIREATRYTILTKTHAPELIAPQAREKVRTPEFYLKKTKQVLETFSFANPVPVPSKVDAMQQYRELVHGIALSYPSNFQLYPGEGWEADWLIGGFSLVQQPSRMLKVGAATLAVGVTVYVRPNWEEYALERWMDGYFAARNKSEDKKIVVAGIEGIQLPTERTYERIPITQIFVPAGNRVFQFHAVEEGVGALDAILPTVTFFEPTPVVWKTYRSSQFGFSVLYPENLTPVEGNVEKTGKGIQFRTTVNVAALFLDIFPDERTESAKMYETYDADVDREIVAGGTCVAGKRSFYDKTDHGHYIGGTTTKLSATKSFFSRDGNAYVITRFRQLMDDKTLSAFLESFRFTQPAPSPQLSRMYADDALFFSLAYPRQWIIEEPQVLPVGSLLTLTIKPFDSTPSAPGREESFISFLVKKNWTRTRSIVELLQTAEPDAVAVEGIGDTAARGYRWTYADENCQPISSALFARKNLVYQFRTRGEENARGLDFILSNFQLR